MGWQMVSPSRPIKAMVLAIIISVFATFVLMSCMFSMFLKRLDDEYTSIIAMLWEQVRHASKDKRLPTPMDYINKKNGENYTILLLGKMFTSLNKKTDRKAGSSNPHQGIVNEIGAYLNVVLASDIEKYKEDRADHKKEIKDRLNIAGHK